MNEAEYLMKNYGELRRVLMAETDNTLLDLHNSSYDMKAEFNNWVFECVHPFIDDIFITEPAVPSTLILVVS